MVAPAGLAWQEIYLNHEANGENPLDGSSLFSRLYTGDGSHPAALGSYLTGLVMYGAMTGRTPLKIGGTLDGADEADVSLLKEAAHRVIFEGDMEPLLVDGAKLPPYPWVVYLEEESAPEEGAWYLGNLDVLPTYIVGDGTVIADGVQLGNSDPISEDGRLVIQNGGVLESHTVSVGERILSSFCGRGLQWSGGERDLEHESGTWLIPGDIAQVNGKFSLNPAGMVM